MTEYNLLIAALLMFIVGVIHSVLGEVLIFRHLRQNSIMPTLSAPPLTQRHVRIHWASWHIVTLFGFALGALLLWLSYPVAGFELELFIKHVVIVAMLLSSILVLYSTRGRHPGWLALAAVALLIWL
ncbi:MAG: hypothetical protein KJP04_01545 [Arenicella sp.]|nr:hypothetical protein [Arenicella sp.]